MFGLGTKALVKYSLMPGVVPRMQTLAMGGFHYIPYFIALVYYIVRLLPENHPYLNPENIGRFGIRHVIAEAANNLVFKVQNIDQVFLFFIVLIGLVMLFVQIIVLGVSLIFSSAMAAPLPGILNWNDFFVIQIAQNREQDLASIMLDLVFGVPAPDGIGGFFQSCVGLPVPCENTYGLGILDTNTPLGAINTELGPLSSLSYIHFPFPYHMGMHRLFAVYSTGVLIVAVMVGCYFVATVVAETAQSGIPFGRRFNKIWAPIRIVVAFGLLVPLTVGLNSAQYLVLSAAKYGSAFATNGWNLFNNSLTTNYLGALERLVSTPNVPEVAALSQFMFAARVCAHAYDLIGADAGTNAAGTMNTHVGDMGAYVIGEQLKVPSNALLVTGGTSYQQVMNFIDPGVNVITIRFGVRDTNDFRKERGFVFPYCGEIRINLTDSRNPASTTLSGPPEQGPLILQQFYWNTVRDMWFDGGAFSSAAGAPAQSAGANNRALNLAYRVIRPNAIPAAHTTVLNSQFRDAVNEQLRVNIRAAINAAVTAQIASGLWDGAWLGTADPLYRKGWAGAGIWYNRIAEMNGAVSMSVFNLPSSGYYPHLMEQVRAKKAQYNQDTANAERFNPEASGIKDISTLLENGNGLILAKTMYVGYKEWTQGEMNTTQTKTTGNAFLDAISSLLGTNGLYDMRRNANTHPLAQLVGIGRSLVESSIRSLGYATIAAMGGAGLGQLDEFTGKLGYTAASFFVTVAMLGLTIGFILFYVVPFLPFIYFFFAVGGWVKGIFEAMVGVPLWALAHIRIDGHGLPGSAALNGYFLIFEIFLRPILIVFGLLASISIFSALVRTLNSIFPLVTENITGYDIEAEVNAVGVSTIDKMRGPIDEFFFTVLYAIIVYMIGMSSFKLIDQIPNNILRWMGQSVATFNDQREDAAQGLVGKATIGTQQTLSKIGGGLQGLVNLGKPG